MRKDFFRDAPAKDLAMYEEFKTTYARQRVHQGKKFLSYIVTEKRDETILLLHGAAVNADYLYRRIMQYRDRYRIIAPDITGFKSLDELSGLIHEMLERESVKKYILYGGSFGGAVAQALFKLNPAPVKGLIISNTFSPKPEKAKLWILILLKLLPFPLFKFMMTKKLNKLVDVEVPGDMRDTYKFMMILLNYIFKTYTDRKTLISHLSLAFDFSKSYSYSKTDFKGWRGKSLVVSAQDDPNYKDSEYFLSNLPNAELYELPKGGGHASVITHEKETLTAIDNFLQSLH